MQQQFMGVKEVSEILGVSESKGYGVIRELNSELKAKGFIIVPGKISRRFFFEKCYCDETEESNGNMETNSRK